MTTGSPTGGELRRHSGSHLLRTADTHWIASLALAVAFLTIGCDNLSTVERELVHTDAEIFEVVARTERVVGMEDSSRLPRFLRIDSRPIDNTTLLPPPQTPAATGIALDDSTPPSTATLDRIARERRAILERLSVEEGGPFFFPGCEGVRTGEPRPRSRAAPQGTGCPKEWRRYVTVGLPRRGVGEIPEKVRRIDPRPFDSAEVWTVLVT